MQSYSFNSLGPRGFHRLHYTERGSLGAPVAVCVHGMSQNARSFDALAERLAQTHRVICLDVVGRGESDWLADSSNYTYEQYVRDAAVLFAHLDADEVDWVGTSMGGVVGMLVASLPGTPVRRLVVNDIGPLIPKAALERIALYMRKTWLFNTIDEMIEHMRKVYAPFGPLTDAQWRAMAEKSLRRTDDGMIAQHYDPAIADPLRSNPIEDVDLWPYWEAITCPTLVLRGAESDLLLPETAQEMTRRGPKAKIVEFAGIGHAPALLEDDQISAVCDFLTG